MWVVSVHWKGLLWSQLWANPASLPFQPTQREQRGGGKLHTNLLTMPILISEPSCNQLTPKHNNPPILPVTIFYSDLLFFFSFALETGLSACSLFQINTFLSNQKWCCYFTCTMSLFPASVLLSVIFSSCEERRNNPDTADLWLSCTPLRLVMVSSRFCRRSRTFCTVLFLWDSGSAGGTHTWVILTTENCHAAT